MADATQPPAETLANLRKAAERKIGFTRRGSEDRVIVRRADLQWMLSQFSTDDPDAALTSRAGGDAIPAGWQLVPVEMTREMSDAGRDATGGYPYAPHDIPKLGYMQVNIIWKALLATTPKPPAGGDAGGVRWRERWYGSDPQRGSAIVDEAGNLIAYFGGDKETHRATTAVVAAHNAALATPKPPIGGDHG